MDLFAGLQVVGGPRRVEPPEPLPHVQQPDVAAHAAVEHPIPTSAHLAMTREAVAVDDDDDEDDDEDDEDEDDEDDDEDDEDEDDDEDDDDDDDEDPVQREGHLDGQRAVGAATDWTVHDRTPKLSNTRRAVGTGTSLPSAPLASHEQQQQQQEEEDEKEDENDEAPVGDELLGQFERATVTDQVNADDYDGDDDDEDKDHETATSTAAAEKETPSAAPASSPVAAGPPSSSSSSFFFGWFSSAPEEIPQQPLRQNQQQQQEQPLQSKEAPAEFPQVEPTQSSIPDEDNETPIVELELTAPPELESSNDADQLAVVTQKKESDEDKKEEPLPAPLDPTNSIPPSEMAALAIVTQQGESDEDKKEEPLPAPLDPTNSIPTSEMAAVAVVEDPHLEPPTATPKKEMSEEERLALDDAFQLQLAESRDMAETQPTAAMHGVSDPKPSKGDLTLASTRTAATTTTISANTRTASSTLAATSAPAKPLPRGQGVVHPDTPIPNSDVALRILRKFAYKTRPKIVKSYGGSKPRTLVNFLFGSTKEDPIFVPYRNLMDSLYEDGEDRDVKEDSEFIVDMVMGESGDSMAKARVCVAAFVNVFSVWCHTSSGFFEARDTGRQVAFSELLAVSMDIATLLVAHGCLDCVQIGIGLDATEYHSAVHMLAEALFNADLSIERSELAGLKFLLTTGCRVGHDGDALLRGSHLLQTIRTMYHVYLTTESSANKTTARASLQQLIMSVFARLVQTDMHLSVPAVVTASDDDNNNKTADTAPTKPLLRNSRASLGPTPDHFPSPNHRDAYLVLRSICKLSMRSLPNVEMGMHSHIGLQTSGSNVTWDGERNGGGRGAATGLKSKPETGDSLSSINNNNNNINHDHIDGPGTGMASEPSQETDVAPRETAQLVYTSAIHPALESKILALELILYVLRNTHFSARDFVIRAGSQFHAAIRNYLCVSLLKNCTSDNTDVVNLSLRIFVPLMQNFRSILKTEIEAFVTNVFFVILDSKNSPAEHKSVVVKTFDAICSDPTALAEIFLNYDCDLSAVDLFHRIVNTLARVAKTGLQEPRGSGLSLLGISAAWMEKFRNENRELRLDAMRALRQVLASLHASIVEPVNQTKGSSSVSPVSGRMLSPEENSTLHDVGHSSDRSTKPAAAPSTAESQQSLVEIYDSKKRRRAEEAEAVLRFNQKPAAGLKYAAQCGHLDGDDPVDVARYLLRHKDMLDKTQIGEYLGREADYQNGFAFKVLHEYIRLLDFTGLMFDDAIRYCLSGFRLPGEAQKIDRIMEKFAERYTEQNPTVFPSADVAFILAFSIIMLNTDLHNPAIKEERRMTKEGFVRNNRGIADGKDLPEELLVSIFDRIKANPISLKEDDDARERTGERKTSSTLQVSLSPSAFFSSHYNEMDKARESNFQKERDHIVRTTESLLKRRRHGSIYESNKNSKDSTSPKNRPSAGGKKRSARFVRTEDSGLRDEYVSPMFEVTWGPALAAFSTAIESGNGTVGALISIASDEELELAAENAAETIEVCLTGFRFAVCTAGLCGNDTARDAYMLALSRFSQLGTGVLLEPRHIRCTQTLLSMAREDGELLGRSWDHVFRALSEINRFHQLFQLMARNDRAAAAATARRKRRLEEQEKRRQRRQERKAAADETESIVDEDEAGSDIFSETDDSLAESELFYDDDDYPFDEVLDAKMIDETNARVIYEAVSESWIESIYQRSSTLSARGVREFISQLCFVSQSEISVGNSAGTLSPVAGASDSDLTAVTYRQQHALLTNLSMNSTSQHVDQFHHSQPNIYNLQKLVEVCHYNMDSRPRLIFAELWSIVADHLTRTALHWNPAIAMYAVDSFRQLSIQYLHRDELEVFEFQKRFLKPLETVMAQSQQASTKELLLDCVSRIIQVFREGGNGTGTDAQLEVDAAGAKSSGTAKGGLRSGWIPILTILGLGGCDETTLIAVTSYNILAGEMKSCLTVGQAGQQDGVLLNEHFIETVQALFMMVSGPHDDVSVKAMDQLLSLTSYLADPSIPMPQARRKPSEHIATSSTKQDLELWWPILLGLSRVVGDARPDLRAKGLKVLEDVIRQHFVPKQVMSSDDEAAADVLQTLQLIFRGVLTPILEFAELSSQSAPAPAPPLPEGFDRFLTGSKSGALAEIEDAASSMEYTSWMETTLDQFLDVCVRICIDAGIRFGNQAALLEEIFAILNNCFLSDSGSLAVRGIRRLEQLVTSDLDPSILPDDLWATVCHLLRRCFAVKSLPPKVVLNAGIGHAGSGAVLTEQEKDLQAEYAEAVLEFVAEDSFLANRRYVASNAVMVVGELLTNNSRFKIALRWKLFLIAGLGDGIMSWERAAAILATHKGNKDHHPSGRAGQRAPDYMETVAYGRKWLNRFLLQLASIEDIAKASSDLDPKSNRYVAAQKLVLDETHRLLVTFLEKEAVASQYRHTDGDVAVYARFTALVKELLGGYNSMDAAYLQHMTWINPVLLSSCIQSKNEDIRLAVQKLVQRTSSGMTVAPYPVPTTKSPPKEKLDDMMSKAPPADDVADEGGDNPIERTMIGPPLSQIKPDDDGLRSGTETVTA